MPTYHFLREQGQVFVEGSLLDRLTINHNSGVFERAGYIKCTDEALIIKNCEESLILIDPLRGGMNKLHIGNLLMRNPHAEVYGSRGEGPRVDLNKIDLRYAKERLVELEKWRNEEYREQLRQRYDGLTWYSVSHRLNQLDISQAGLEIKIEEMGNLIEHLSKQPNPTFVSDTALEIEKRYDELRKIFENTAKFFNHRTTKKDLRYQKIMLSSRIIDSIEEMHNLIQRVFNFAEGYLNFDFKRAAKYWQEVDSWGECKVRDHSFTRYETLFFKHLRRHFPGSNTPGSVFTGFQNPRKVIDFAWQKLREQGYGGRKKTIELDFPEAIGLEGVVALSELPPNTEVKREQRDEKHEVNVVSSIAKKPTNHIVIIVEPLESGRHGFTSIYPGKYCPELTDKQFWETHAFIE